MPYCQMNSFMDASYPKGAFENARVAPRDATVTVRDPPGDGLCQALHFSRDPMCAKLRRGPERESPTVLIPRAYPFRLRAS